MEEAGGQKPKGQPAGGRRSEEPLPRWGRRSEDGGRRPKAGSRRPVGYWAWAGGGRREAGGQRPRPPTHDRVLGRAPGRRSALTADLLRHDQELQRGEGLGPHQLRADAGHLWQGPSGRFVSIVLVMSAALERPAKAAGRKLPEGCRKGARHAPCARKAIPIVSIVPIGPIDPSELLERRFAQLWPLLADVGHLLANSGQHLPNIG